MTQLSTTITLTFTLKSLYVENKFRQSVDAGKSLLFCLVSCEIPCSHQFHEGYQRYVKALLKQTLSWTLMLCFHVRLSRNVSVMRPALLERMSTNLPIGHSLLWAGESGIITFHKIASKEIAQSQLEFVIRRGFSLSMM